jgi:DNA polymerase-3 subunit epsilon
MTGGQVSLNMSESSDSDSGEVNNVSTIRRLPMSRPALRVIAASELELEEHHKKLDAITASSGECIWRKIGE